MFLPPPINDDNGKNQFTNKPPMVLGANSTSESPEEDGAPLPLPHDVPQGDDLYLYVLNCLDKGSAQKDIRQQLIAFGYTAVEAEQVVAEVVAWRQQNPSTKVPASTEAATVNSNMMVGGIVCLIGLVVTIGSMAASSGGGTVVIAWGAILWGAIQFFRGLSQSNQP